MQNKSKEKEYITPGHEKKIKRKEEIGELLEFYSGLLTKKELGVLELRRRGRPQIADFTAGRP
jgi:hypothetical protein